MLWKQPWWMLRTALAGSRASKQIEQSLVFKALAAAAAQALTRRRGVARAQIDEAPSDFAGAAPRASIRQHLRAQDAAHRAAAARSPTGRPRPHRLRHDQERAARGREGGARREPGRALRRRPLRARGAGRRRAGAAAGGARGSFEPAAPAEQAPAPTVRRRRHLTDDEIKRYSRHLILEDVGVEGQKRLKASKVAVVGAGGLGSPALLYLAAAGVGTLTIVDDDTVETSNLQRQIVHDTEEVGEYKAASAASSIKRVNPWSR